MFIYIQKYNFSVDNTGIYVLKVHGPRSTAGLLSAHIFDNFFVLL